MPIVFRYSVTGLMMSVVLNRPYQFVPPHRGNWWPSMIQRFRIVDHYLRLKEGVHSFECRNLESFEQSLRDENGVLLTPNHCRYADPLAMGWPARLARTHVYAMASWHLFNKGWLDGFAIRKMGGFSIHREAADRQSLDTAIQILVSGERPLILFPEGTTSRMNDSVKELLDGVTFIARAAAKKSAKANGRKVIVLPVAMKYLCKGDCRPWLRAHASQLEDYFGSRQGGADHLIARVRLLVEKWLGQQEKLVFGEVQSGGTGERRGNLTSELLERLEDELGIQSQTDRYSERIRAIRAQIIMLRFNVDSADRGALEAAAKTVLLSQELVTFDDSYLMGESVSDTRLVETIQRLQESCFGKAKQDIPLHAVIEFGEEIQVPASKAPRGERDPLLDEIKIQLESRLESLSHEAREIELCV